MSEDGKNNQDSAETRGLISTQESQSARKEHHPGFYMITESVLVIGWLPTIIFFVTGVLNGLLLLVEQGEYDR